MVKLKDITSDIGNLKNKIMKKFAANALIVSENQFANRIGVLEAVGDHLKEAVHGSIASLARLRYDYISE